MKRLEKGFIYEMKAFTKQKTLFEQRGRDKILIENLSMEK